MSEVQTRGLEITVSQTLVTETCCNCGMLFAMTNDFKDKMLSRRDKPEGWFYCPAGHRQHYLGQTKEQQLAAQLAEAERQRQRAQQNVAMWQDDAREARQQAEHERKRAAGYKGHATRMTKRAKAGVCPCCNRTFQQLARHMATRHPTFTPMALEVIDGGRAVA